MMKQKQKVIIICIVIIGTVALLIKNVFESKRLENKGVYVLGKIDKIDGASQGVKIFISYDFNGKVYKNDYVESDFENKHAEVNKRYFVKVDPANPEKFHIEYLISVPDTLLKSPHNGWESLPIQDLVR